MDSRILIILLLFATISTKAQQASKTVELAPGKVMILLSKEEAGNYITQDELEGFFENIRPIDMAVQMKKPLEEDTDREALVKSFKDYLKTETMDFSPKEMQQTVATMLEAFQLCNKINAHIFPDTLRLIKINTDHYGPSVYYTREADIMIPADALAAGDQEAFLSVMLHELFHVYSRLNLTQKKELYKLIGFEPIQELIFPPAMDKRVLLNPDGVDMRWKIELQLSPEKVISAIPAIISNENNFMSSKPAFFGYLQFALFEVNMKSEGVYEVVANKAGFSTLPPNIFGAYFQKIQDNTQYIIHPDEIMADNFVILALKEKYPKTYEGLSDGGKQLLSDISKVLKSHGSK